MGKEKLELRMETVWTDAAPQEMDWTDAAPQEVDWTDAAPPETDRTVAAPLEMMWGAAEGGRVEEQVSRQWVRYRQAQVEVE